MVLPSIKREIKTNLHAGRIKEFKENWVLLTQDPWVLQTVQGFQLPLASQPVQTSVPPQLQLSLVQQELVSIEIQAMLGKQAIRVVQPDQRGFVSQILLVPKKDGGHRPVINLKALNKFIVEEHFKMEGFHMVKDLIKPGDWLAKIDLKDAYFLVPVHPSHQRFLQFQWQDRLYQFQCLPFGLSCAPRTFTKLMKPVVALLRERGIRLIVYLDNILILCSCWDTLINQLRFVRDLFQVLGLLINEKKSQLDLSQEIVFLGLAISTTTMQVSLPREKVARIQQEAKQLQAMSEVSVQKLAMLVGRTTAAKQAIRVAPLFHRHLQALINRVIPLASSIEEVKQCYHQMVELSVEARQELVWWTQEMQEHNGAPLTMGTPDMVIESDASRLGWGATLKGQGLRTGGQWSTSEQEMHINCLELLVASLAIQTFAKEKRSIRILVRTDNISTRAYINHFGGTHSWQMNHLAMQIWKWCIERLDSRASPRCVESRSRRGVKNNKRPLRLDAPPTFVLTDQGEDGSPRSGHVCILSHTPTPTLLQLEAGPSSGNNRCICSRLESFSGVCKPSVVPPPAYTCEDSMGESQGGPSGSNMEDTTMVPSLSTTTVRISTSDSVTTGCCDLTNSGGIHNAGGSTVISRLAIIRNQSRSGGLSKGASRLLESSWRSKTKSTYESLFKHWNNWCQERGRDPIRGPVADILNFLAELFEQGFQYRSLNAYRSAISSVHEKIDGIEGGKHPIVSRMLKGVFNERPPRPKYESVWKVDQGLTMFREDGGSASLSLQDLTVKTAMLLVLTRTCRGADLAALDLRNRSYVPEGVVFQPYQAITPITPWH